MAIYNKMTILPLHDCDQRVTVPIGVGTDLTVENVEGILRPEHFDLWSDYVPKKEREDLNSTRIGIVHRFSSEDHTGKAEADSQDKVFKTFVFLRLIRPTRERFSNIQLSLRGGQPDVFSFAQPTPVTPNAPNLQVFNTFHQGHLERLIRFLSGDSGVVSRSALVRKIEEQLGSETDIYSEAEVDLFPDRPTSLAVGKILPDMLELRNLAVHGRPCRPVSTVAQQPAEAVH